MTLPDVPALRGLDASARDAIESAARTRELAAGATIYAEGDASESFYVVLAGAIELSAIRRGDEAASVIRTARAGDSFGEEAVLAGLPRRARATAAAATRLAEIPIAVFLRATGKSDDANAARERRYLARAAARDLLAAAAFARELGDADREVLLDAIRLERFARGGFLYEAGDRADALYFVVEGLVQVQRETAIVAYVQRGDFVGDEEVLAGAPRALAAVAAGDSWCAIVPRDAVRTLADRNPSLLPGLRRIAAHRDAAQASVLGANATQHVLRDLYRMQMARSLLAIDQDQCVRCGHCAWSCESVHGVSRLVRRGDKVIARVDGGSASLLLPNTCQHCRHAACMIDCPTGAIGRDPEGEVFIRPDLCTGCGNCVRACPWDNIQLAQPKPALRPVAVKCDLCRGLAAPACVEACPTDAIRRLDPARDVGEVAEVMGLQPASARAKRRVPWGAISAGAAIAAGAFGATRGWSPAHGAGRAAGVLAALMMLALAAYAIPKRWIRVRRGARTDMPRSRTRVHLIVHILVGALVPAAVLAHTGLRMPTGSAGALVLALALTTLLGGFGAIVYRALPAALTRLERKGALPEDLRDERDALLARLFREATGASARAKLLADRVLIPYARAPLGWIALVASRRTLGAEEARLRAQIARIKPGLADEVAPLVKIAVELRALPARRVLTASLRGWAPLHVIAAAMVIALLAVHVVHP